MNAKKRPGTPVAEARDGNGEKLATFHAHLIRIPDRESRKRAIMALGESRESYCGFTDFRFLVTNDQLDILKREAIPFELLS